MKYSVDTADLARMYTEERLTSRQIAAKVGIPSRTVARYLKSAGVPMRNPGDPVISRLEDRDWLIAEYIGKRKSTPEIASDIGCSHRTVALWLSRHGIEARPTGAEMGHQRNSTEVARERMRAARRGKYNGADNPNWKGGVAFKDPDRNRYPYKMWAKAVKDRDGWKCTECSATGALHAHHIKRWRDYPELRYDLSNGITLCYTCHEAAHGHGFKFRWMKARPKPTSASALSKAG